MHPSQKQKAATQENKNPVANCCCINDSRETEQSAGRVANLCAVLGQVSSADRTDIRAVNIRSRRSSTDGGRPKGTRYWGRKRRAIANNLIHCRTSGSSNVHRSRNGYGRECSGGSTQAGPDKHPLQAMLCR